MPWERLAARSQPLAGGIWPEPSLKELPGCTTHPQASILPELTLQESSPEESCWRKIKEGWKRQQKCSPVGCGAVSSGALGVRSRCCQSDWLGLCRSAVLR